MSVAFEALAAMPALVNVDFTNNYNLKGSWTGNTTYSSQVTSHPLAAKGFSFHRVTTLFEPAVTRQMSSSDVTSSDLSPSRRSAP